jgi:hypothetical protein
MGIRRTLTALFILSLTTLLVSCNYRLFDLAEFPELQGALPGLNLENKVTEENFLSIYQTIIQPKCIGCHKVGGKAEDILFSTYKELMDATTEESIPLIIPGKPEESIFYTIMLESAKRRMPPKKSEIPPVPDDRLEVVRKWILNGARESIPTAPISGPENPQPAPVQPNPAEPEPAPTPEQPNPIVQEPQPSPA